MSKKIDAHIQQMYKIGDLIGSGAYGHVWKAQDKANGQVVALKKVFGAFRNNIDAQRTYRQVQILKKIDHPNIIKLHRVIGASNQLDLYLIFQLMEADLLAVAGSNILTLSHQKYILFQLLKGIEYLHQIKLIHRDLKPSNVLLDSNCKIKICDFGLVRSLTAMEEEHPILSEQVATKWYRSPELLLGSRSYSYPADVWSVGCIAAQLLIGKPLFEGKSVIQQLQKIIELCGPPSKEDLQSLDSPVVQCLVGQINPKKKQFSDYFSLVNHQFYILLKGLLVFNPNKRLTANQALNLQIFRQFLVEKQQPSIKAVVPQLNDNHRFHVNQYRKQIYSSIPKKLHASAVTKSTKQAKITIEISKQNLIKTHKLKEETKKNEKSAKIRVRSTPIEKKSFLKSVSKHHSVLHYKKKSTSSAYVQERLQKSPYSAEINYHSKKHQGSKHTNQFKKKFLDTKGLLKRGKRDLKLKAV